MVILAGLEAFLGPLGAILAPLGVILAPLVPPGRKSGPGSSGSRDPGGRRGGLNVQDAIGEVAAGALPDPPLPQSF